METKSNGGVYFSHFHNVHFIIITFIFFFFYSPDPIVLHRPSNPRVLRFSARVVTQGLSPRIYVRKDLGASVWEKRHCSLRWGRAVCPSLGSLWALVRHSVKWARGGQASLVLNQGSFGVRRQVSGRALGKQSLFQGMDSGWLPRVLRLCPEHVGPRLSLSILMRWPPAQTQAEGECRCLGDTGNYRWIWALKVQPPGNPGKRWHLLQSAE